MQSLPSPHRSPPAASGNVPHQSTLVSFGIKVTKKIPLVPQFDFPTELSREIRETHLSNASSGLTNIFSANYNINYSMEVLYRSVEMLVKYNNGKQLYELVSKAIQEFCDNHLLGLVKDISDEYEYANSILSAWILFEERLALVQATFAYLFEVWVRRQPQLVGLDALAAGQFRHRVVGERSTVLVRAIDSKLGPGLPRNDPTVVKMLLMVQQLNLMPAVMENLSKSLDQISLDFSHFSKVYSVYEDFVSGFSSVLPPDYRTEYNAFLRDKFLVKSRITADLLKNLVMNQNFIEFESLIKIAKICENVSQFSSALRQALFQLVKDAICDPAVLDNVDRPIAMVIQIKSILSDWITKCQLKDEQVGLTSSLEESLNQMSELSVELLCCYCDFLIKGDKIIQRMNIPERRKLVSEAAITEDTKSGPDEELSASVQ